MHAMRLPFLTAIVTATLILTQPAQSTWVEGKVDLQPMDPDNPVDQIMMRAMATLVVPNMTAHSQATQVCRGVYVATAHGAITTYFNPADEKEAGDVLVVAYPYGRDTAMTGVEFISPRLSETGERIWTGNEIGASKLTDYVFIRVDNPIHPYTFIRPISATAAEREPFNDNGQMAYYRPQHAYEREFERNGVIYPDFTSDLNHLGAAMRTHKAPLRAMGCDYNMSALSWAASSFESHVHTNCPAESRVSGSPFVLFDSDAAYLAGIHQHAGNDYEWIGSPKTPYDNYMASQTFCEMYEREDVCGQPCATISDVELLR